MLVVTPPPDDAREVERAWLHSIRQCVALVMGRARDPLLDAGQQVGWRQTESPCEPGDDPHARVATRGLEPADLRRSIPTRCAKTSWERPFFSRAARRLAPKCGSGSSLVMVPVDRVTIGSRRRNRGRRRAPTGSGGEARTSRLAGASPNGETRTRTGDTTIFSRVLYQLSYLAARGMVSGSRERLDWRRERWGSAVSRRRPCPRRRATVEAAARSRRGGSGRRRRRAAHPARRDPSGRS